MSKFTVVLPNETYNGRKPSVQYGWTPKAVHEDTHNLTWQRKRNLRIRPVSLDVFQFKSNTAKNVCLLAEAEVQR